MTDNKGQLLVEDIPGNNTQQQRPFHVVLVDIKKSVEEKAIHCVERSSAQDDYKFVALSYRWGEVPETMVDTGVGYLATITSFDLGDFFRLCETISQEVDLQSMDYVWVDAICVKQTDYEQRKATIYHMTDIYQRANYILAVPDLHLRHLYDSSSKNVDIIQGSRIYGDYLYDLIQGNRQKLIKCDQMWLDENDVPQDRQLRHMLTNYTEHFATGFTNCQELGPFYNQRAALYHIYDTNPASSSKHHGEKELGKKSHLNTAVTTTKMEKEDTNDTLGISEWHTCDNLDLCPFKLFHKPNPLPSYQTCMTLVGSNYQNWKHEIIERSQAIRQSMVFFMDLIKEWSTRAWVISEFHIAKNKNNKMKYWFLQLGFSQSLDPFPTNENSFFEFDFVGGDSSTSLICGNNRGGISNTQNSICIVTNSENHTLDAVYQIFHATMRQQLSQQTFLEMILKSKASKHEDRFHAILPSSEYKSILDNKDRVDSWKGNVKTLMPVKLELYQWMDTKPKIELLFLSALANNSSEILPTFATTNIVWPNPGCYPTLTEMSSNFDLADPRSIQLVKFRHDDHQGSHYKLNIRPREYYRLVREDVTLEGTKLKEMKDYDGARLQRLLALVLAPGQHDILLIPALCKLDTHPSSIIHRSGIYQCIVLVGCSVKNVWVLTHLNFSMKVAFTKFLAKAKDSIEDWEYCQCDENSPGFDIY